jgi:predicted P-loop ATPase/GTPase
LELDEEIMYRFLFHVRDGEKQINIIHTFSKKKLDVCDIKMMIEKYDLQSINSFAMLCKGDNSEDGVIRVTPTHEFVFLGKHYRRRPAISGCVDCAFKDISCGSAMTGRPSYHQQIFVEVK